MGRGRLPAHPALLEISRVHFFQSRSVSPSAVVSFTMYGEYVSRNSADVIPSAVPAAQYVWRARQKVGGKINHKSSKRRGGE